MNRRILTLICLTCFLSGTAFAQHLVMTPAISPDGNKIAYSLQGDIWTMDLKTKQTTRLTIHEAYESHPTWNDTGDMIAFTANRAGNSDIFTIPAAGGPTKRITYHSTADNVWDWSGDYLYFTTRRAFRQIEWNAEIYRVAASGGTPERVLTDFGDMPAASGQMIAIGRGSCRTSREDYDGPADLDIWVYHGKNKQYKAITDNSINDFQPRWAADNQLFYISATSGRYNISRQTVKGDGSADGQARQITSFKDDGIQFFDVSKDGSKIVYTRQNGLYLLDVNTGKSETLSPTFSDYRFDPLESRRFTNGVENYALSPDGKKIANVIRGEVFISLSDKEKRRAVNVSRHAYRDRDVAWLNDSTVIFVSDREGQNDLFLARSTDDKVSDLYKSLKTEVVRLTKTSANEAQPVISPDRDQVAFRRGRGQLVVADIDENGKLSKERILHDEWSTPAGVTWSPDNKWLAYSVADLTFNSEVYIHAADGSSDPVNVSMHPKRDSNPVWSPDGSKLGFSSDRSGGDSDVWFVWLSKAEWEKTKEDREDGYYFDDEDEEADDDKDADLVIDFENIHDRQQRVTSQPGNEGNIIISKDGKTFYFTGDNPTRRFSRNFYSVEWDGSKAKKLASNLTSFGNLKTTSNGTKLYGTKRGVVNLINFKDGKMTPIAHSANMKINHPEEYKQIFDEAWSAMKAGFYDPQFHGQDWDKLRTKYRPWCLSATTRQDFQYMFNLMLGQLNASHLGLRGGRNPESVQRETVGLLGVEFKPGKKGVVVERIVPGTPADKEKSKLFAGDVITAVNGESISANKSVYAHLDGLVNQQVLLAINGANGKQREVVIRPVRSIGTQLYEQWVNEKRALTEKYSGGKLGYIHIRGMNMPSFERFERELMASGYGKEGIVIDVRFNGGGWTTDYLMTVLNVRQHAYTIPRGAAASLNENSKFKNYYPYSERLPLTSWTKPSVAMCNESSYSNAEIFSHAYKQLNIGKLVGMPTFGAVISTGGQRLIDGSLVRMPFRAWYVKETGENMENGPAVPDIIVNNGPGERASMEDSQLMKAVETLMKD